MESRGSGNKVIKKLVRMLISPKKHSLRKKKQILICGKGFKSGRSEIVCSNTVISVKWLIEV